MDIFLYQGEANPADVKLTDPTVLAGGGGAVTGIGAIVFAVAALAGSVAETFTGTGAETFAAPALTATGAETFASSGAIAFAGPALDGTGTSGSAGVTGTGAVLFSVPGFVAAGAETFSATGAQTFTGPSLAGAGSEAFTGTGAEAIAVSAFAGVALETFTSTGATSFAGPAMIGGVPPDVTGTGALAFSAPSLSGLATGGDEAAVAFGGGSLRHPRTFYVHAVPSVDGQGATRIDALAISGEGDATIDGRGATTFGLSIDGVGALSVDGTGYTETSTVLDAVGGVFARRVESIPVLSPARSIHGVGASVSFVGLSAIGDVVNQAPDAMDLAWTDLQAEEDELVMLGVIA